MAAVEMSGVSRRYGQQVAVDNLDLCIPQGGVYALLGPNGAGKTTIISMLLGLIQADSGSITVLGGAPGSKVVRRQVGSMLQISGVSTTLKTGELIEQFRGYYPSPLSTAEVIAKTGLEGLERARFGSMSGGQMQRVLFALALCGNPSLLFLDEPSTGMDIEMRRRTWAIIRELVAEGRTIVLTTHYLEEAEALATRVGVLQRGRLIAEGSVAEIKSLVGGKRVSCTTSLSDQQLQSLPGVSGVRRHDTHVELEVSVAEPLLRTLLALDDQVADVEVSSVGLDDAFLSLTAGTNATKETA